MHAKNNRVNTDFQIIYFLVGACHTADGAYALLCDLREDREIAVRNVKATALRSTAVLIKAKSVMADQSVAVWDRLEAEASIAEIEAVTECNARNIYAAQAELATINRCIEALQPLRLYAHLPDVKAHQAAQSEEWRLELIHRSENQLLTTGSISPELLATMRMHPQFRDGILPSLVDMGNLLETTSGREQLMRSLAGRRPTFMQLPSIQALQINYTS